METIKKVKHEDSLFEEQWRIFELENIENARLLGASFGKRNLPSPVGDSLINYLQELVANCQMFIDGINARYQSGTIRVEVNQHSELTDQQTHEAENEERKILGHLIPLEIWLKSTTLPDLTRAKFVRVAIIVTCLFDAVMSCKIFIQWGYNLLESIIMAILFAIILGLSAHLIPDIIRKGKTPLQRRLIAVGIAVFMTALFYGFAATRVEFLTQLWHQNNLTARFNPWYFVELSNFCLAVAVAVYLLKMPTKLERGRGKEYQKVACERDVLQGKLDAIKKQKLILATNKLAVRTNNASTWEQGYTSEERTVHLIDKLKSIFITENLLYRTDGHIPTCYHIPFIVNFRRYFKQ